MENFTDLVASLEAYRNPETEEVMARLQYEDEEYNVMLSPEMVEQLPMMIAMIKMQAGV